MSAHKGKVKQNRSKKALEKKRQARLNRVKALGRALGAVLFTGCLSLMFVVAYGWLTRCDYFGAKFIIVSGTDRLSQEEVLETARIQSGINIIQVNLKEARERLYNHPWIESAEVIRQFPDRLTLRIDEHRPVAIFDMGHKYLVNTRGEIFKRLEPGFEALPTVRGIHGDAVRVAGIDTNRRQSRLVESVMQLVKLNSRPKGLLTSGKLIEMTADAEMGLSVLMDGPVNKIKLGFGNYDQKLKRLAETLNILKKKVKMPRIDTIDLNDINNVVIKPATT